MRRVNDFRPGVSHDVGRGGKKFWKYIWWYLVNTALVNAYLLSRVSRLPAPPRRATATNLSFRMEVAEQLIGGFSARGQYKGKKRAAGPGVILQENLFGHGLEKRGKRMCVQCKRTGTVTESGAPKRSIHFCTSCDVTLCPDPCFMDFHRLRVPEPVPAAEPPAVADQPAA